MKKFNTYSLPTNGLRELSMKEYVTALVEQRLFALNRVFPDVDTSAVPGRIIRAIKLDSIKDVMTSLVKVRDLARVAAQTLRDHPSTRADRLTYDRTEIVSHLAQNAGAFTFTTALADSDVEFVSTIAIEPDPDTVNWTQRMQTDHSANRAGKFAKLYSSLILPTPGTAVSVTGVGKKAKFTLNENDLAVACFEMQDEKGVVRPLLTLKALKDDVTAYLSELEDDADVKDAIVGVMAIVEDYRWRKAVGIISMLDHLAALMYDIAVWPVFITPRPGSMDMAQNALRQNGLFDLSAYCHALLTHPIVIEAQLIRSNFELLRTELAYFPPVSGNLLEKFESAIEQLDLLDGRSVAEDVLASATLTTAVSGSREDVGWWKEIGQMVGLTLDPTSKVEFDFKLADVFTDLSEMANDAALVSAIAGTPLYLHDFGSDPLTRMGVTNYIKTLFDKAAAYLFPFTIWFTKDKQGHAATVRAMTFRNPYVMRTHHLTTGDPTEVTSATYDEETIHFTPYRNSNSADTRDLFRLSSRYEAKDRMLFTIREGTAASRLTPPWALTSPSYAEKIRKLMGEEVKKRSLLPSRLTAPDTSYSAKSLEDPHTLETLLEDITETAMPILDYQLIHSYARERFATQLSSFALLFTIKKDSKTDKVSAQLVTGLGMPYGVTYEALNTLQGMKDDYKDLIALPLGNHSKHLAIRLLKKVPMPKPMKDSGPHIKIAVDLATSEWIPIWAGDAKETGDVTHYTKGPSLLHFTLKPIPYQSPVTVLVHTKSATYHAAELYGNLDAKFTPSLRDLKTPVHFREQDWLFESLIVNAPYSNFGPYGSVAKESHAAAVTVASQHQAAQDAIKQEFKEKEKELAAAADSAQMPKLDVPAARPHPEDVALAGSKMKANGKEKDEPGDQKNPLPAAGEGGSIAATASGASGMASGSSPSSPSSGSKKKNNRWGKKDKGKGADSSAPSSDKRDRS